MHVTPHHSSLIEKLSLKKAEILAKSLQYLLLQRKMKMVCAQHVMCTLFCVPLRFGKTFVVKMGSQVAYAMKAAF